MYLCYACSFTSRQCFVGCATPSDNPQFYLDCLTYVHDAYLQLPAPRPPLVVNTMGWTQGLGLTLLIEQILLVQPDIIAQIQLASHQPSARQNLPVLDAPTLRTMQSWKSEDLSKEEFKHRVMLIPSMSGSTKQTLRLSSQFGAPDHRDLTMLAYFTSTLANAPTSLPARGPNDPLGHPVAHFLDCLPYRIPLLLPSSTPATDDPMDPGSTDAMGNPAPMDNQARLAVCLLQPRINLFEKQALAPISSTVDNILACLNATLVALCSVPHELVEGNDGPRSCAVVPSNPVCECRGLGVCRAIDPFSGTIYITTGIPTEDLLKVTTIVRGSVNLPQFYFLEQPILDPPPGSNEPLAVPYLGPIETQGLGRVSLPARRSYPRTMHHEFHRTGSSDTFRFT